MNFMTEFNGKSFLVSAFSEDKEVGRKPSTRFNDKRVYKKLQTAEKETMEYQSRLVDEFTEDSNPESIIVHSCKSCNSFFTISYDEYKFYNEHEFPLPARCPSCRKQRKKNLKKEEEIVK